MMARETTRQFLLTAGALALAASIGAHATAEEEGFAMQMDSIRLEVLETDVDTESAKFNEYRDLKSGFRLSDLRISGAGDGGDRTFAFRADDVGRADARYALDYGVAGSYAVSLDYNKIPHRFQNRATSMWQRTSPGTWEIADSTQNAIQGAIIEQFPNGISGDFLRGLIGPYIAAAGSLDLGLQRDRTRITWDLGRLARMAWAAEYRHENRNGLRPYGGNFGFFNVTEIGEPIDYDTTDAEISGEWNGDNGGVRFGYRRSIFENSISTMVWDNPFAGVDGTGPRAYLAPNAAIDTGSRGFADLAPDNEANLVFLSGRGKVGGWWMHGTLNINEMTQDDPLLPYTLNTAIVGVDLESGATFSATDPSTLPVRNADTKVEVTSFVGNAGTDLGERVELSLRYRYYDYDNQSARVEFPGYVRMHSVWEEVPRITVPYSYSRDDLGVELDFEVSDSTSLGLSYRTLSWDRTFRETTNTDEDIVKVTLDSRPSQAVTLRASWETGDRSNDGYDTAAQLLSFLDPHGINNQPGLRKFTQAARDYDDYDLSVQLAPKDGVSLTFGVSGRDDSYPESEFGLIGDEIVQYNFEAGYTPGAGLNCYFFGHVAERDVLQRARQSGGTLSTNPADDWSADLTETWDTWGLGISGERGSNRWDLSARLSDSDGEADFTTAPEGNPSSAVDFGNYEDIELLAVNFRFDHDITEQASWGLFYLYEDYTIDSFIVAGLEPYIPGSFLLAGDNGNYEANVVGVNLSFSF